MIEKNDVIYAFMNLYEQKIEDIKKSLASTKKCAIDAHGSNVSHSDTSKFQYSNLALGIEKRLREAEETWKLLKFMQENIAIRNEAVSAGSMVSLQNIDTEEVTNYLLIGLDGGGDFVVVNDVKVVMMYAGAPLARMLNGKEKGEEVKFQKKTFEVEEIQ